VTAPDVELRHLHGNVLHEHDGGHIPHNHGPVPRARKTGVTVFMVVAIVLVLLAGLHELSVLASKNNPPASCQLLGGQLNILTGWQCG
jgi:hypothetical protein